MENYTSDVDDGDDTTTLLEHDNDDQATRLHNEPLSTPSSSLATANNSLTYLNCLALVLGIQFGSGIFSTPAVVSNHVPTPAAGILVWALAGVLVWTGASCFIELGTIIPRNGGMQEYLRAGYGDFAGFFFSWVWLSIVRPCSIAMICMIFAEHINRIALPALGLPGGWVADKGMALLGVFGITGVNCLGLKTGAKVAIWFLVLKLLIILSIVVAGMVVGIRDEGGYLFRVVEEGRRAMRTINQKEEESVWKVFGEYVTAGFATLWVYGGWEAVGFVVGEMKDVRDLPRVINSSILIAMIGFTLMVTALYIVLPISTLRENDIPLIAFSNTLYGPAGSLIYTIAISLSALGSLNANVFAVGRLAVAASQRDYIPSFFSGSNSRGMSLVEEEQELREMTQRWPSWVVWCITRFAKATGRLRLEQGVPVYAMLLNAILTSIYVLIGTFRGLLTFVGITEYLIFILTVLALFRLRLHPPTPPSSPMAVKFPRVTVYRTNIVNPVIFCVLSTFLVGRGVVTEAAQGGALIAVFGLLWVFWWWKERRRVL
ncbi:large neutral amino acids transporter small subunit 1 [Elaphomyces granulatus]